MNIKSAQRLTSLFDAGYQIKIESGPFETGFVSYIGRDDYDEDDSPFVYTDEFTSNEPLENVDVSRVRVFAPIDWLNDKVFKSLTHDGFNPIAFDGYSFKDFE